MGFLDRIFGGGQPQFPALEPSSDAAARLAPFAGQLAALAGQVRDHVEAVPERDALYVFVGRPPKEFGVVRYRADGEENLIQLMRERKLPQSRIQEISDQARAAYVAEEQAPRFTHQAGKRALPVIDSETLGRKLDEVFAAANG